MPNQEKRLRELVNLFPEEKRLWLLNKVSKLIFKRDVRRLVSSSRFLDEGALRDTQKTAARETI